MTHTEFSAKFNEIKVNNTIVKHHFASERGYNPVGYYNIRPYSGRYGKGYIAEYPNKEGFGSYVHKHSNRYYCIEYIITK